MGADGRLELVRLLHQPFLLQELWDAVGAFMLTLASHMMSWGVATMVLILAVARAHILTGMKTLLVFVVGGSTCQDFKSVQHFSAIIFRPKIEGKMRPYPKNNVKNGAINSIIYISWPNQTYSATILSADILYPQ